MHFMAYQHHKRTDSQTEIVPRNQLLCIYTSNVYRLQHDYMMKLINL